MKDLDITIIQADLHWEDVEKNLISFSEKINNIPKSSDLIVLPEMFNTGFTMNSDKMAEKQDGKTTLWMAQIAKEKECVVTGSIIVEEEGNYYNRLIWMKPDGSYHKYNKRHLFRMANEQLFYTAGKERLIMELNGWRVCPLICYDLRFPVWSRNKGFKVGGENIKINEANVYDLLIYVANWPERRSYPWKSLLPARAIENQCYVAAVNRVGNDGNGIYHSGDSMVLNPKGEMISTLKTKEEGIETITLSYSELQEFRKSFPVSMDADEFEMGI